MTATQSRPGSFRFVSDRDRDRDRIEKNGRANLLVCWNLGFGGNGTRIVFDGMGWDRRLLGFGMASCVWGGEGKPKSYFFEVFFFFFFFFKHASKLFGRKNFMPQLVFGYIYPISGVFPTFCSFYIPRSVSIYCIETTDPFTRAILIDLSTPCRAFRFVE